MLINALPLLGIAITFGKGSIPTRSAHAEIHLERCEARIVRSFREWRLENFTGRVNSRQARDSQGEIPVIDLAARLRIRARRRGGRASHRCRRGAGPAPGGSSRSAASFALAGALKLFSAARFRGDVARLA